MAGERNVSSPHQPTLPLQASALDLFLPGFSRFSPVVQQYAGIDLDALIPLLCLYGLAVFAWKHGYRYMRDLVEAHLTSTVYIPYDDEAYEMLIAWVSDQPFARNSYSSLANVNLEGQGLDDSSRKPLRYTPWKGRFKFYYKNSRLEFRRVEKKEQSFFSREKEEVSISCLGRSSQVLKDLLEECRQKYLEKVQRKTLIFEVRDGRWKQTKERNIRPISTVLHDENEKEALLNDVKGFLGPDTREWYAQRGIPYRRGYLLYGPPGTGKSSLSLAIAGCTRLDVHILNLTAVDDSTLGRLFAELPRHCVVLLEDIDAASQNRSQNKEVVDMESKYGQAEKKKRGVTLSGLLNAIDGVGSQEGRVLIMTTNYIERLDAALIRPGRIDRKVEFRLADEDIIRGLFCNVFRGANGKDDKTVERLANDFVSRIPKLEFSAAEVLSLLIEHRLSPELAVASVEAWIARVRSDTKRLKEMLG